MIRHISFVALVVAAVAALAACGSNPPPPAADQTPAAPAAPVECPPAAVADADGGMSCPPGCTIVNAKCLKEKGIIAPH